MSLIVSLNDTTCQFHAIELEWLNDRLDVLNDEISDPSYPTRIALKTLGSIGAYWTETMEPLSKQFKFMKNLKELNSTSLEHYEEVRKIYQANFSKTLEVLELRGANELFERVSELYRKITKKSDAELFSEAATFDNGMSTLKIDMTLLNKLVGTENDQAKNRLGAAQALLNHVSRLSRDRRDAYFKTLTTKLSRVSSCSSEASLAGSAKAAKKKQYMKLLFK